jgi:hypothetical protein
MSSVDQATLTPNVSRQPEDFVDIRLQEYIHHVDKLMQLVDVLEILHKYVNLCWLEIEKVQQHSEWTLSSANLLSALSQGISACITAKPRIQINLHEKVVQQLTAISEPKRSSSTCDEKSHSIIGL